MQSDEVGFKHKPALSVAAKEPCIKKENSHMAASLLLLESHANLNANRKLTMDQRLSASNVWDCILVCSVFAHF